MNFFNLWAYNIYIFFGENEMSSKLLLSLKIAYDDFSNTTN